MDSGADTIDYGFTYTNSGNATGAVETMDINASLTAAAYTGKPAGVYADTVTLTINP
jgi:spore coat protein U-like protein